MALAPPSGPTFVDYPLDVVFSEAEGEIPARLEVPAAAQPARGWRRRRRCSPAPSAR